MFNFQWLIINWIIKYQYYPPNSQVSFPPTALLRTAPSRLGRGTGGEDFIQDSPEPWANLQRRMSEGWAKDKKPVRLAPKESRRAGAAEYVTKDNTTIMRHTFWQTFKVCQSFFTTPPTPLPSPKSPKSPTRPTNSKFKIQNSEFRIPHTSPKSQKSYPSHQFKIQNSEFKIQNYFVSLPPER